MERRHFLKTAGASGLLLATHHLQAGQVGPQPLPTNDDVNTSLPLRYRQVHLDFHTSEHVKPILDQFDPEAFAATLKRANVNSVTCFSRCHHGFIYHDTERFPERKYPGLSRPLLKEQIEACHKLNIRVPIYSTVQWDYFTAQQHPEWCVVDPDGKITGTPPYEAGFYRYLGLNTPYRDFMKAHLTELFEKVPVVDGLFLDIFLTRECSNTYSVREMLRQGLNPDQRADRLKYYTEVMDDFKRDIFEHVRKLDKDCTIFFNGGHVGPAIRRTVKYYSHLELESLPSGGWGYLHFPLTARYARTLGADMLGMTGKFHTSWGDFHSLKNPAALEFECFTMLALNAKCSIGDQLHPNGKLDAPTYDLIGRVYGQVAQKEPWCVNARPVVEIGVLNPEAFTTSAERTSDPAMGAVRMLQEGKLQFDVVDEQADFSPYKVLILPDIITVDETLRAKLEDFLAKGGALLATYKSGLAPSGQAFALPSLGIDLVGEAPYSPDFVRTGGPLGQGLPDTELVMYLKGMEVKARTASVLAQTNVPYFNRTYKHFVSHRHTPSSGKAGYPAATQNGRAIYLMHPVFTQYAKSAPRWCREFVLNAVRMLLPQPLVQMPNAPSALTAALNYQSAQKRYVLHLLHYVPERRGAEFDVVEDVLPVYNLRVQVRLPQAVSKAVLAPQGRSLSAKASQGMLEFTLPELRGHQMIVLS